MEAFTIASALNDDDYAAARSLFEEYAAELEVDLCFQNFAAELDNLQPMYGAPTGALLLARSGTALAGCVGVRKLREDVCEMKRLYVRPAFRGRRLGQTLAGAIAIRGRLLGYRTMVLDTLESMVAARAVYSSMGFRPVTGYYPNLLPNVTYLALDLRGNGSTR